jgi:hypothetical protein
MYEFKQKDKILVRNLNSDNWTEKEFIITGDNGYPLCWDDDRLAAHIWQQAKPTPRDASTYFYQWEKLDKNSDSISLSKFITDEHAESHTYAEDGWYKVKDSKRTWDYVEGQ